MEYFYLTPEDIVIIHGFIIRDVGGLDGIRDHHALASAANLAAQRVFGKDLYADVFAKAAVYARSIIMNHPFLDGNKRTGITSAGSFLFLNGYSLICKKGEIEKMAIRIVVKGLDIEAIALWLKKHSKEN